MCRLVGFGPPFYSRLGNKFSHQQLGLIFGTSVESLLALALLPQLDNHAHTQGCLTLASISKENFYYSIGKLYTC